MKSDPIAAALDDLRAKRRAAEIEFEDEVARIDQAIEALEPLARSTNGPQDPHERPSVRTLLLRLLDESDRDWSVGEILGEYQARGAPVHGKDPDNALRAAVADAFRSKQIVRTATGRYKAARWHQDTSPDRDDDHPSLAQEVRRS